MALDGTLQLAATNLLTPLVLFFVLGVFSGVVKSDLQLPEALGKGISLYLMMAIGFKGGAELAHNGVGFELLLAAGFAVGLSFLMPGIAFAILRSLVRLDTTNAAAIAAHYGSISVVTFVAATGFLAFQNVPYDGYMVVLMALMETPAIVSGLLLSRLGEADGRPLSAMWNRKLLHEVFFGGAVVLLIGSFLIGWVTGDAGMAIMAPLVDEPFKAVLAVFLLEMGVVVGRRLGDFKTVGARLIVFGLAMPLIGATLGVLAAMGMGLQPGSALLMAVLVASASYIVVPAAMRLSLPKANPAYYVTLSLAVTFPFNLVVGIPLYYAVIVRLYG